MKASSNERPPSSIDLGGRTQFNFDIEEIATDEGPMYQYRYVIVKGIATRAAIIRSLIAEDYSLEDEIALINNHNSDPIAYETEYTNYQNLRAECKIIATQLTQQ